VHADGEHAEEAEVADFSSGLFDGCWCTTICGDIVAPISFRRRSMSSPVCSDVPSCWTLMQSARPSNSKAEHTAGNTWVVIIVQYTSASIIDVYVVRIAPRAVHRLALRRQSMGRCVRMHTCARVCGREVSDPRGRE